MCVIIVKPAGIIIPEEKIASACIVNPDGYGVTTIVEDESTGINHFQTVHRFKEGGNNPDEVMDLMTKFKDNKQFIHLRFTTKGEKSVTNCHPFNAISAEYSFDDLDYQFMHNGTIYESKFKDYLPKDVDTNKYSDSYLFNEYVLKPLMNVYVEAGKDPLEDKFFNTFVEDFTGNGIFTIFNNDGRCNIYGGKGETFEQEGKTWWASNAYSFNRSHREPKTTYHYGYGGMYGSNPSSRTGGQNNITPFRESSAKNKESETKSSSNNSSKETTPLEKSKSIAKTETQKIVYSIVQDAKRRNFSWQDHSPPEERITFKDLMDDHFDLSDVTGFSDDEIAKLVEESPTAATILILDLIYELYEKKTQERIRAIN